jgi:hypothetical protein
MDLVAPERSDDVMALATHETGHALVGTLRGRELLEIKILGEQRDGFGGECVWVREPLKPLAQLHGSLAGPVAEVLFRRGRGDADPEVVWNTTARLDLKNADILRLYLAVPPERWLTFRQATINWLFDVLSQPTYEIPLRGAADVVHRERRVSGPRVAEFFSRVSLTSGWPLPSAFDGLDTD